MCACNIDGGSTDHAGVHFAGQKDVGTQHREPSGKMSIFAKTDSLNSARYDVPVMAYKQVQVVPASARFAHMPLMFTRLHMSLTLYNINT